MGIFDLGSGAVKGFGVRCIGCPGKTLARLLRKVATPEALACLCVSSERAILSYIGGQAIENEEKCTHDASLDGGDDGYSACG
jgi:hypothetical protein